ncbi:hypothetical protein [Henriciella aquimarina]|uniref:hypothetical protein n=1 Tax=Henriciella aquimarina TaxID=545261 RepID=UPI000A0114E4|nr:hypothetical protein [Henriciella aquimarina]
MENRNLDIGYVFEKTFSVIGQRFSELALLALVFVGIPNLILSWLTAQWIEQAVTTGGAMPNISFGMIAANILLGLLPLLLQAAAVHTTVETMSNRPSSFNTSLSTALGLFLPLLALSILLSLGYAIAFMLLIVPGLILMTFWAVAVPAFVAERTGIFGAFGRSMDLTEGQRWRIFGLMVLAFIAFTVAGLVIGLLSFGSMAATQTYATFGTFSLWHALLEAVLAMVSGVVAAVGVAVLYVHLRDLKEGTSIDRIGDVFR